MLFNGRRGYKQLSDVILVTEYSSNDWSEEMVYSVSPYRFEVEVKSKIATFDENVSRFYRDVRGAVLSYSELLVDNDALKKYKKQPKMVNPVVDEISALNRGVISDKKGTTYLSTH